MNPASTTGSRASGSFSASIELGHRIAVPPRRGRAPALAYLAVKQPRSPIVAALCVLAPAVLASLTACSVGATTGLLARGAPFPAWSLTDHTGASRTSAELAGKRYLLWFYPKAMTPG